MPKVIRTVKVIPKSGRAKNRFSKMLRNNNVCLVDRDTPTMLHLRSQSDDYWFWVDKINDLHWRIIE